MQLYSEVLQERLVTLKRSLRRHKPGSRGEKTTLARIEKLEGHLEKHERAVADNPYIPYKE
jgi:hypothetical protein